MEAKNADHVMSLLRRGNKNRTQEATAANEVSSRSHAVLQVIVEHGEKTPGTVSAVKVCAFDTVLDYSHTIAWKTFHD